MTVARTVGEILSEHTTLEVESIDRMYLNAYVPGLQHDGGVAAFSRAHRGQPVQALLSLLALFRLLPAGWRARDLAEPLASLLGLSPRALTAGRLTYQLRRLRLHGLIARIPATHRYRVTDPGLRTALFFTRAHARLFRPGLALVMPDATADDAALRRAFVQLERAVHQWCAEAKLAP